MKNSHLPSGPEEVKKRYRQLAKQMHPDAGQCKLTPAPANWSGPKNTASRIE